MASTQEQWHSGSDDSWHGTIEANSRFAPEEHRYHLYIGLFCPFAHRVNLVRILCGLDDFISVSVVKPFPKGDEKGWPGYVYDMDHLGVDLRKHYVERNLTNFTYRWEFAGCRGGDDTYSGATEDPLFASGYLHDLYFKADKSYSGRYSVPVLWDKHGNTIVNNESFETLRWLPIAFSNVRRSGSPHAGLDLLPALLKPKIEEVGVWLTRDFNSGVYRAGFAKDQETYNKNLPRVFAALNSLENLIHKNGGPYILGDRLTELDILAYATAIRFDVVYVQHFKCNLGTIRGDYPVVHEWMKNLYHNVYGFKETTDFRHIKENYTKSHADINPLAITPMGPFPDIASLPVNLDFGTIKPGSVDHPLVLEYQKELPSY